MNRWCVEVTDKSCKGSRDACPDVDDEQVICTQRPTVNHADGGLTLQAEYIHHRLCGCSVTYRFHMEKEAQ